MQLVKFRLLSNHQFVSINADAVTAVYTDTSREGKEGTKIHTTDGDYTMVEEDLNRVLYALDSAVHPEDYPTEEEEEESRPLPDEGAAKEAANILKRFCRGTLCKNCTFYEFDNECKFKEEYPTHWDIPKGDE